LGKNFGDGCGSGGKRRIEKETIGSKKKKKRGRFRKAPLPDSGSRCSEERSRAATS